MPSSVTSDTPLRKYRFLGGVLAGLLLVAIMTWAFLGYLTPDMMLNWENIASLCGF